MGIQLPKKGFLYSSVQEFRVSTSPYFHMEISTWLYPNCLCY